MIVNRLIVLDFYRGLAAFLVMMYHFQESFNTEVLNNFIIRNGHVFTDYFFILSGFVIHYSYSSKNNPRKFLLKRFNRVYPLLFSITSVYFLYRILGNIIVAERDFSVTKDIAIQFLYSISLLNSTPVLGNLSGSIGPSWSISGEVIAYLLYALCMYFNSRKKFIIIIVCILLSCLYLLDGFYYTNDWGFIRTLLGFNIGVYMANHLKGNQNLYPIIVLTIFALIFVKADLAIGLLLSIVFAFIIIFTAALSFSPSLTRAFDLIGRYSFGFYLWHRLVINICFRANQYLAIEKSYLTTLSNLFIVTLISVLLAYISYIMIEKKCRIFNNI